jgi:5-methylcytosine-specific restriction endonuclease McrA
MPRKNPFDIGIKPVNIWGPTKSSSGRKSCPKAVKETVWRKYNGNRMTGKCYVCKGPITFTNFEVGHNKPHSKGGKWTVGNLRPICRSCNRSMGTMSIEAFKRKHFSKKKPKKTTMKKRTKRKSTNPFGIQPIKFRL